MVCYERTNGGSYASDVQELCNRSVPACKANGGCYFSSCLGGCGLYAPECKGHNGANYATLPKHHSGPPQLGVYKDGLHLR